MPQWKGSMAGRATNLERNREAGHVQLYTDYFHPEGVVPKLFLALFLNVKEVVWNNY
jgi:hypothetical protein